jgi:2-polyprenyl-3-methyl-5-hydroxy-6-metoxy-1,4-benzoquinol methylase
MRLGFNITASDYYENKNGPSDRTSMGIPYMKFNLNADEHFPKTFDVVICSEVLEHTNINLKNGIKKVLTACHKDSILIITLPNIYSINNLIRICRGINIVEDFPDEIVMKDSIILDMRDHKRECTKKDLEKASAANNLTCIDSGYCQTTVPFNHSLLAKIIPPSLRAHLYGIYTLS